MMTMTEVPSLNIFTSFSSTFLIPKADITECFIVIFVEQADKTLLVCCENKWINYLKAKIDIIDNN